MDIHLSQIKSSRFERMQNSRVSIQNEYKLDSRYRAPPASGSGMTAFMAAVILLLGNRTMVSDLSFGRIES